MRLDEQLMDQKAQTEKAIKEYEQINRKTQKYQQVSMSLAVGAFSVAF